MPDALTDLWSTHRDAETVGRIVKGLSALAADGHRSFWLIVQGGASRRFGAEEIRITLEGIDLAGTMLTYGEIEAWGRQIDGPCIHFQISGKQAIIAPATAAAHDGFRRAVSRFFTEDWYDADNVYLGDLDHGLASGSGDEVRISILRPDEAPPAEDGLPAPDEVLVVFDEHLRLGDMTWAELDTDGDGNRHLHLVMSDGRYRRICCGDLSR